jgi:hypothetical protein
MEPMTYREEQALVASTVATFPSTFEIRDRAMRGRAFRISPGKSYYSSGAVQLVVQIRQTGADPTWGDYARVTPSELRSEILRPIK